MDAAQSNGQVGAAGLTLEHSPGVESIAVCCSGGGIRSAAFNLGALQALQASPVYERIRTIAAVSGGSYIAAGHALAAHRLTQHGSDRKAYALRSPEEEHLRDHSRYLLPSWPVSAFGVLGLLLGLTVNLVLVGACLWIGARLLGVFLRATHILTGLGTEDPHLRVGLVGWGCAALAGAAVLLSWWTYLRDRAPAGRMDRVRRPRALTISWRLLLAAAVGALALVAVPAALVGLSHVGRCEGGNLGAVVRWLGFGAHVGCAGAPALAAGSAAGNAGGTVAALTALVALIRAAAGQVRTYRKDLDSQSWLKGAVTAGGRFVRDRLAPWSGTALVVLLAMYLGLRFTGSAAGSGPDWWWWQPLLAALAALVIVAIKAFVDINRTSLHRYYRDRLAAAYAFDPRRGRPDAGEALLSELAGGEPELVICAAANCTAREQKNVPPGRGAVSFTFTPVSVGLSERPRVASPEPAGGNPGPGRAATSAYEQGVARLRLFDAVAVSGAAVSPVMGKMTQPSKRVLFALGNVRLGVWLPAPDALSGAGAGGGRRQALRRSLLQPDLKRLWAEMAGTLHIDGRWMYVTDGGHYDNLGLVEALRRRPDAVLALDASGDAQGTFATLGQAVALARTECGCDITISPADLQPDADSRLVTSTVAVGSVTFRDDPDQRPRPLLYARLGVTASHPWDVQAYLRDHPGFPTTSTIQQLYDADEFEAYRAMGEATAAAALAARVTNLLPVDGAAEHSSGAHRAPARGAPRRRGWTNTNRRSAISSPPPRQGTDEPGPGSSTGSPRS